MRVVRVVFSIFSLFSACGATVLHLQVSDYRSVPIRGVRLSAKTSSDTSPPTDIAGKTELTLSQDLHPGDYVLLVLVAAPSPRLKMLVPVAGRGTVDNQFLIEVFLWEPGQALALNNEKIMLSITRAINENGSMNGNNPFPILSPEHRATNLKQIADELGLKPTDVDAAIRKFEKTTKDPIFGREVQVYNQAIPSNHLIDLLGKVGGIA
jgi:hypothetical protein